MIVKWLQAVHEPQMSEAAMYLTVYLLEMAVSLPATTARARVCTLGSDSIFAPSKCCDACDCQLR